MRYFSRMAKSNLSTTVAVLRAVTGTTAAEFATTIGKSADTVKSVESGRLALSDSLAAAIADETGVSVRWLLAGDAAVPPVDFKGEPYTLKTFAQVREARSRGAAANERDERFALDEITLSLNELLCTFHSARDRGELSLAALQLHRFVSGLAREFGESDARSSRKLCNSIIESLTTQIQGVATRKVPGTKYRLGKKSKG